MLFRFGPDAGVSHVDRPGEDLHHSLHRLGVIRPQYCSPALTEVQLSRESLRGAMCYERGLSAYRIEQVQSAILGVAWV